MGVAIFLIIEFFIVRAIARSLSGDVRSGPGALGVGLAVGLVAGPFNTLFAFYGGRFLFFEHPRSASIFYLVMGPLVVYVLSFVAGYLSSHTDEDAGWMNGIMVALATTLVSGLFLVARFASDGWNRSCLFFAMPISACVLLGAYTRNRSKRTQPRPGTG